MSLKRFNIARISFGLLVAFLAPSMAFSQTPPEMIRITISDTSGINLDEVSAIWFERGVAKKLKFKEGASQEIPNRGLVVAHQDGFQYCGLLLGSDRGELVLSTVAEPGRQLMSLASPVSIEVFKKQREAIGEFLWSEIAASNPNDIAVVGQLLPIAALIDPEKVERYIDENDPPAMVKSVARKDIVASLAASDFESAAEIANSVTQPDVRAMVFSSLLDHLPSGSANRDAVESELIGAANSIDNPGLKLAFLASVAEQYQRDGADDKAAKIIEQHLEDVQKLPSGGWSGYPRSLFAALIVNEQPEQAVKMIEGITKENELRRAQGRLAFHCCKQQPKLAIKLIREIKTPENAISGFSIHYRIAHRIADSHPELALEIADLITEPIQRAWALGLIAMEIHSNDPAKAKELLQQARGLLASNRSSNGSSVAGSLSRSEVLAALIAIAETVDPIQMESIYWQAVWESIPRSRWVSAVGVAKQSRQNTAAALARYEPRAARVLCGEKIVIADMSAGKAQVVFGADQLVDSLRKIESDRRATRIYSDTLDLLLKSSEEDATRFWKKVSQPTFLVWPTEVYESR